VFALVFGGGAVSAAMGTLWFEHSASSAQVGGQNALVQEIPSRVATDGPIISSTPTTTAVPTVTPVPAATNVPKAKGGTSSEHTSGGDTTTAPTPTRIVVPVPTITIPAAPPPPPYTDAEAIADVEKQSPDAKYGLVTGDCDYLNYGEWSPGSSPPWPARELLGAGGVLVFLAHATATGGYVQYYGCY
jgi:hypothetical protein